MPSLSNSQTVQIPGSWPVWLRLMPALPPLLTFPPELASLLLFHVPDSLPTNLAIQSMSTKNVAFFPALLVFCVTTVLSDSKSLSPHPGSSLISPAGSTCQGAGDFLCLSWPSLGHLGLEFSCCVCSGLSETPDGRGWKPKSQLSSPRRGRKESVLKRRN